VHVGDVGRCGRAGENLLATEGGTRKTNAFVLLPWPCLLPWEAGPSFLGCAVAFGHRLNFRWLQIGGVFVQ
jgi:hypothetical protein